MNRTSMKEFPKTVMNRKASDVYEAALSGPVSLTEHGTSRFVIMSRRLFDEHFAKPAATGAPQTLGQAEPAGQLPKAGPHVMADDLKRLIRLPD